MLRRFLIAGLVIVALLIGWRAWSMQAAFSDLRTASFGNSFGPEEAEIVIVELMDYRCADCRIVAPTLRSVMAAHPDVRFVVRHLPVYREPSIKEARLALAAGMQGRFAAMHDILIRRERPVEDAEIDALAQQAGLDAAQLKKDMYSDAVKEEMLETLDAATALAIIATPTFIIGKTLYTYETTPPTEADFNRLIDDARKK